MIQLFNKGQTDFTKNGITLNAQKASVTFQDNGRFDLDLTIPVPDHISFDYGMIIRCSVPYQQIPEITLGTVSYYEVSNAEGSTLWSKVPTLKRVYYKQWIGYTVSGGTHVYSVGDKVTYLNNNYRCTYFDESSPLAQVPPNNSSWWTQISNTTGQPGKVTASVEYGDVIMKMADFNSEYMEAATTNGKTGYILIADVTATGDSETRTIPAQTITAQNFTITEIEKSSDGQKVSIHAEHISYGLGRTMLGDCNLVNVNPATAILFIQGAMKETYAGEIYTNLTEESITADWSWKNAQNAILDPKSGLLQFTSGQMIRNDLDVFLIEKGTAVPKYSVKYGTNLLSVKWDGNTSSLVTRIYPTAKTEDGDTLLLPEEHIDSVRVVPYIRPEVLNTGLKVGQKETQSDGTEIELTQDIVYERMRTAASNRFTVDECDKVDITLEVDWVHLPDTEEYKQYNALKNAAPGDWVEVVDGPLGVSELIQLTGYTFDPILERYEKCTFGKNKVSPGVASYDLQTGAVTGRALANGSVTGQNIQANSITAREIEAYSITAEKIASRSITAETIAANAITAEAINANAITAEKIAAYAITAEKIAANAITAGAIAANAIQAEHIASAAVTADKIAAGSIDASKISALAITTEKLAAGAVTADKIGAGSITAGKIDTTDLVAINATLGTADIADARIALADIDFAKVKDLNAQSAYFGQAVIQSGLANKLFIPRLSVDYAQIVSATIGDLVIQATDDNYYKLDVDLDGNVTATQITPTAAEIAAGHTSDGRTIYTATEITASELNTSSIYASHALMDEITANIINTDQLFAREATIAKINALDLSSNTYIQSVVGDWVSGSTITQTINAINTRITSLGYGTFYYQTTEPSHSGLVAGDVWIKPTDANSWNDVSQYTWQDMIDNGMTWDDVLGRYEMYCWTGERWKLLYDSRINADLQTQINQNAYAITLKADQTEVDTLSGDVTEFAGILEVQSEAITAAVETVNAKGSCFVQNTDPSEDYEVHIGDTWVRGDFDGTWRSVSAKSWRTVSGYKWSDLGGAKTFVWNGTSWIPVSDRAMEVDVQARIDITTRSVEILASEQLLLGDEVYRNSARITVEADRITQEVERAQNAENGKISKTSQYQTADEIVSEAVSQSASSASGLYIAKTTVYQTADAIVSTAVQQAASGAAGLYIAKTTSYQTADAIINEAVRQSGVNAASGYIAKTSVYQSADAIVSAAESWTAGQLANYSTTTQTSQLISAYVTNNAYGIVSGIAITAAGIDISGSQYVHIASGGNFKVTTGDFLIDSSVAETGYVMLSGSSTAANATFRLKKNGELTVTKLLILNENGTESELNLKTAGLWKLNYKTVKSYDSSGGYCTSMTFSDGTSVNFNSAASVTVSGLWSGNTFTATASNGASVNTNVAAVAGGGPNPGGAYTITPTFDATTHQGLASITGSRTGTTDRHYAVTFNIDASSVYTKGYNDGRATYSAAGTRYWGYTPDGGQHWVAYGSGAMTLYYRNT